MDNNSLLIRARNKRSVNARTARLTTRFLLSWRGGGTVEIVGYSELAKYLSIKESSIPVFLSNGGGTQFNLARANPLHGEMDTVTVARLLVAKEPKRRGRPSKRAQHIGDARLGTELAESAKTVPKTRNRRTNEKQ
jgi:hypothetical protein